MSKDVTLRHNPIKNGFIVQKQNDIVTVPGVIGVVNAHSNISPGIMNRIVFLNCNANRHRQTVTCEGMVY
jgi:hypothetical protein